MNLILKYFNKFASGCIDHQSNNTPFPLTLHTNHTNLKSLSSTFITRPNQSQSHLHHSPSVIVINHQSNYTINIVLIMHERYYHFTIVTCAEVHHHITASTVHFRANLQIPSPRHFHQQLLRLQFANYIICRQMYLMDMMHFFGFIYL